MPLEIQLRTQAIDIGGAVPFGGTVEECSDVVELNLAVVIQIPVQPKREVRHSSAANVHTVEFHVREPRGDFPATPAPFLAGIVPATDRPFHLDTVNRSLLAVVGSMLSGQEVADLRIAAPKESIFVGRSIGPQKHRFRLPREWPLHQQQFVTEQW